jgi:hypothetical protein
MNNLKNPLTIFIDYSVDFAKISTIKSYLLKKLKIFLKKLEKY